MIVSLLLALATPASGVRCRCPELSLDRYFLRAEIVVVGRVRTLKRVPPAGGSGAERIEVVIAPLFRRGPFKGTLTGVVLATPVGSSSCGVEVTVDRDYLIFASRGDPSNPNLAWFTTCSGSRQYAGGPDVHLFSPYPDLPPNRVLARLAELADSTLARSEPQGPESAFHTSPACWREPRIYHQGSPSRAIRDRIRISRDAVPLRDSGGTVSSNGAYRVWTPPPSPGTTGGASAYLLIDDEMPRPLRLQISGAIAPPAVQWVSEKLLFLRIAWGRVQFTDLVFDVELGRPIYEEDARFGAEAFAQFQSACLGQCPCLPVPGSADSLASPPRHRPVPGEQEGLGVVTPDNLGYLDQDWDGRVFTDAGGRRFTVSQLKGSLGREEYPMLLHEVREVDNVYWLRVSLYRVSPCSDPEALPVHRGWVPAFSPRGRFVAGSWPGGC